MSGFISAVATGSPVLSRDNRSNAEWAANGDLFRLKLWDRIPADDYFYDVHFGSEWWPSRSSLMGGFDGVPENQLIGRAPWWGWPSTRSGCNGRYLFSGITRDAFGSPLPFATVRCFRTSPVELVSTVVSDGNGFYSATTPYADSHFLTIHQGTSPEVAGASVSTLLPG